MKTASTVATAVLGTALVTLLPACAGIDAGGPAAGAKAVPEYRTGSNIPVRSADSPATEEERERAADQIRALQRAGNPKWPKGS